MRTQDEVRRDFVRQWTRKAAGDLAAAELLAGHGEPFNDLVCFHAQQSAEKHVKAFLVGHLVEFRKTHDMGQLIDLVAGIDGILATSIRDAESLTRYSVDVRYPLSSPASTREDAAMALDVARKVRDAVLCAIGGDGNLCDEPGS